MFIDTEGILTSIEQELKALPKIDITISEKDISTKNMVVLDSLNTNKL